MRSTSAALTTTNAKGTRIGWNQKRMIARVWEQEDRATGFVASDITTSYVSPWDQSIAHLDAPFVPADMERLARAQIQLMRDKNPVLATGGRLFVASLDRRGMINIRPQCDLESEPQVTPIGGTSQGQLARDALPLTMRAPALMRS